MILVIDNYDSFTYNLVQYFYAWEKNILVRRNDAITIEKIKEIRPEYIVISPGPGTPKDAGISVRVIETFAGKIPILGVCLGMQAIGVCFGGKIVAAKNLLHGKTSAISHDGQTIFRGLANPFIAVRYHSLAVEKRSLPAGLMISATSDDGEIMGLRWKIKKGQAPVEGVQFHPESILTREGKKLLKNFRQLARMYWRTKL